ncbi:MAG TPA: hypothetical protein VLH38_05165 [Patescibacteria group bacterium]|nr:hypothetical protein [Patescibacteria group bacterium]
MPLIARSPLEIKFSTIPSTFIYDSFPPTREPYQRVVKIESSLGRVGCRYQPSDAPVSERLIEMPAELGYRLQRFFKKQVASHDPERPRQETRPRTNLYEGTRYNCHAFAMVMQGEKHKDAIRAGVSALSRLPSYAPTVGNLALGEHGFIAYPNGDEWEVSHSLIGLGEAESDCVQVTNTNGNLGFMPYDTALDVYARGRGNATVLAIAS